MKVLIIILVAILGSCSFLKKGNIEMLYLPQDIKIVYPRVDTAIVGSYHISKNRVSNQVFLMFLNQYTKHEIDLKAKHIFWNKDQYSIEKALLKAPVALSDDTLIPAFFEWFNIHKSMFFRSTFTKRVGTFRLPTKLEFKIAQDTIGSLNASEYIRREYGDASINDGKYRYFRVAGSAMGKSSGYMF